MHNPDVVISELLEKHGPMIRRVVTRVGGRAIQDSREDVAQAVAMSLWQQVSRAQPIAYPTSYIYRAAVRETVRAVRQELDRVRSHAPIDHDDEPSLPSALPDPETAAAARQLGRLIEDAIAALAADRRTAVRLHLSGYSVEEIMDAHGWSYQKARNLIARGMSDLRQAVRPSGGQAVRGSGSQAVRPSGGQGKRDFSRALSIRPTSDVSLSSLSASV